jgi:hypothetical protein
MNKKRTVTFQFIDGTNLSVAFPEQAGHDSTTKVANIRKALEAERIPIEIGGKLLLLSMRNVKYVEITPTPEVLPKDIIRDAQIVA